MQKTLVFMKTHYINDAVISEYHKLQSSLDDKYDCLLFIDNHTNIINAQEQEQKFILDIDNQKIDTFLYNKFVQNKLKLPYYSDNCLNTDLGRVMWYCSDYPFYIIRNYYPEYDYYWSLENDVFCNGNSYKPFFDRYNDNDNDLIASNYRAINNEDWFWKYQTEWCYKQDNIYGCFFPVVRMSAKAADFLYEKRLSHAEKFKNLMQEHIPVAQTNVIRWIFCEAFVATELANNGFKCEILDEPHLRYLPVYNLNIERIFEKPDFRLYHPIK